MRTADLALICFLGSFVAALMIHYCIKVTRLIREHRKLIELRKHLSDRNV